MLILLRQDNMTDLFIYMFICSFTPGPGNILALRTVCVYGFKNSFRLILGICIGYTIVQAICTIALYELNSYFENFINIIKYIGFAYMLFLSLNILYCSSVDSGSGKKPSLLIGLVLQLVNIKIYFYIITLISVYFLPSSDGVSDLIYWGCVAVFVGSVACLCWSLSGIRMRNLYNNHCRFINLILALMLFYCAVSMLLG